MFQILCQYVVCNGQNLFARWKNAKKKEQLCVGSVCHGHKLICVKQTFAASTHRVQSRPEVFVVGTSVFVSNGHLLLQSTEYDQDQKYLLWA